MQSFTYGTTPEQAIREAVSELHTDSYENRGKYDMLLNVEDLLTVMDALYEYGSATGFGENDERRFNAQALRSDILATLGIEEI